MAPEPETTILLRPTGLGRADVSGTRIATGLVGGVGEGGGREGKGWGEGGWWKGVEYSATKG